MRAPVRMGERLTHAANIFGDGYEFESGEPPISYELHKSRVKPLQPNDTGDSNVQARQHSAAKAIASSQ